MKLNGNEKIELCAEKNSEPQWTISQLTLEQLLNDFILSSIKRGIECTEKPIKEDIKYLSINNIMITKKTRIHARFNISLREYPKDNDSKIDFECMFGYLDISDFYNAIMDLYFDYSDIFNTKIDNIKIKLIDIEIFKPISFTPKGFINSKVLKQYDLDGQISILSYFLKSQKWEFINNNIIFTELINDKLVDLLVKQFNSNNIIDIESQKKYTLDCANTLGINDFKKNIEEKIKKEKSSVEKSKKIIDETQEYYALNLHKYRMRFNKGGTNRWKKAL